MKQMNSLQNFFKSYLACNFASRKFVTDGFNVIKTINPFFITGLTDGEGSFVSIIRKNPSSRLG